MCGGAEYIEPSGKAWKVFFPSPKAALPIKNADGSIDWVKWGVRREEPSNGFIKTGWARIETVEKGSWDKYEPQLVPLAVQSFMEKDAARKSHWIAVPPGIAVQGLVAHWEGQRLLYVVTEATPEEYSWVHDRWPRLVPVQAGM